MSIPNRKNNEWSTIVKLSPTPTSTYIPEINMLFRVDLGKSGNHLVPEIPETKYLRMYYNRER